MSWWWPRGDGTDRRGAASLWLLSAKNNYCSSKAAPRLSYLLCSSVSLFCHSSIKYGRNKETKKKESTQTTTWASYRSRTKPERRPSSHSQASNGACSPGERRLFLAHYLTQEGLSRCRPATCGCGARFSIEHCGSIRHNEIRDLMANLLTEICSDVLMFV